MRTPAHLCAPSLQCPGSVQGGERRASFRVDQESRFDAEHHYPQGFGLRRPRCLKECIMLNVVVCTDRVVTHLVQVDFRGSCWSRCDHSTKESGYCVVAASRKKLAGVCSFFAPTSMVVIPNPFCCYLSTLYKRLVCLSSLSNGD